jgi:hypothetical protein
MFTHDHVNHESARTAGSSARKKFVALECSAVEASMSALLPVAAALSLALQTNPMRTRSDAADASVSTPADASVSAPFVYFSAPSLVGPSTAVCKDCGPRYHNRTVRKFDTYTCIFITRYYLKVGPTFRTTWFSGSVDEAPRSGQQ